MPTPCKPPPPKFVKGSVRVGQAGREGRVGRLLQEGGSPVDKAARFLGDYIALSDTSLIVMASWVAAAWLVDVWDKFPHLAITSPEKRCGKTTLLDLLNLIVPNPCYTSNISPAALYRLIEEKRPTLLFDEAQSLNRQGSEAGEINRELLNAGIGKNAHAIRCGGRKMEEIREFSIYSPKVFAMIGEPDGVLADRSLPVTMRRKTKDDDVQRYRSRVVEPIGNELREELKSWAEENEELAGIFYVNTECFDIENDRMAELLLPLQVVLTLSGNGIELLEEYATSLDERDSRQESQSAGVRMLAACREIFDGESFIPTSSLIEQLIARDEEPWHRWNKGDGMNPESLAKLLRPYGIKSQHNKTRTQRGYFAYDFEEAWSRYLPSLPIEKPSSPSKSSNTSPSQKPVQPVQPVQER